jgi:5-methylcytosine-specific restriction endonuclease McrA
MSAAADLHARILQAHATYRQTEHTLAVLLAQMAQGLYEDFGYASITAYAARELDLSARKTKALVYLGRRLPELAVLDSAFAAGELSWTKARELLRVVTKDNESEWVERARHTTSRELEAHVSSVALGDRPPRPDRVRAPQRTRITVAIDAQDAEVVRACLAMLRQACGLNEEEIDDGALLAEMARRILHDAKPTEAPTAERYRTVVEQCPDCRRTSGIDAEVDETHVGLACCDGEVQDGRDGPTRGHVARVIPPATRNAVMHRDRWGCAVPGCSYKLWVQVHHIVPRHTGGDHREDNLTTLCSAHHRAVHGGVVACRLGTHGGVEFEFADGRVLWRVPWKTAA